jgi:outer membrane protein assembly factor BamA
MNNVSKEISVLLCFFTLTFHNQLHAQEQDSTKSKMKEGWSFGALPVVAYDSDVGLQYGAIVNLFNFGDGTLYPDYMHSLYLEWSNTTKGSMIARFYYDSEYLIPKVRFTADISYLTERTLDFYGFNGFEAVYNPEWEDENDPSYKSRVFYRHERKMFRVMAGFQGNLMESNEKLKWITGFTYFNNKINPVDIEKLNKGKDEDEKLPDIDGLYDLYIENSVLKSAEKDGNQVTYLKGGIVYDGRDFDAFPTKGIWTEAVFSYAPRFLGDWESSYLKFTFIHRHYLSLVKKKLVIAYRLGYQGTIAGDVPFHIQPHIVPIDMRSATSQGLGGKNTLRGVLRNRVVGDGIVLGNFEVRWIFFRTLVFKQNLYLGTNLFFDAGRVVKNIDRDLSQWPADSFDQYFNPDAESFHTTAGIGIKVGLNENFIISGDYGRAFDKGDGTSGFYLRLYWLF